MSRHCPACLGDGTVEADGALSDAWWTLVKAAAYRARGTRADASGALPPDEDTVEVACLELAAAGEHQAAECLALISDPSTPEERGELVDALADRRAIVGQAHRDAALFASEFPGETLEGSDWDSEAWATVFGHPASVRRAVERLGPEDAWEIYHEAILDEVARLAEEHTS